MNRWVNEVLNDIGLTKKDLRYNFKHFYIPAFNPLWWIITIALLVGTCMSLYLLIVGLILIAPQP